MSAAFRSDDAGFTLLELLVTLAVMALLSALLFTGLRFGAHAWDGSEAHGAGMDEVRLVQDFLRREIEQAYPVYVATDPTHPAVDFQGSENAMVFFGPSPQAARTHGRSRIALAAIRDGKHIALMIRAQPELGGGSWSDLLLRNLAAVQFSYFGPVVRGGTPSWRDVWPSGTLIPQLVRLQIKYAKGDARLWPDLIVAPRIETDASCVYDYATLYCQGRS
ncbi:MAG TPA: prepilin-type N-terminal cleavage/methylation domain-containing protein [Rhizomicrobium sp.]|jgi:general secretion pathway protein J